MYCLLLGMFLSEFLVQRREFIILPRAEMKNMSSVLQVPLGFVPSAKLRVGEMMSPFFSTALRSQESRDLCSFGGENVFSLPRCPSSCNTHF